MVINTAREIAARIWCDQDYSNIIMNPELAEKIAEMLMEEANRQEVELTRYPKGDDNAT